MVVMLQEVMILKKKFIKLFNGSMVAVVIVVVVIVTVIVVAAVVMVVHLMHRNELHRIL